MNSRSRRIELVAGAILIATALGILCGRLAFIPVPWADSSAFFLPALELVNWPPQWRMHAQAAFVPTYDQANFNLMPALPLLLGLAERLGLGSLIGSPELANRALSLVALLTWAWVLWSWLKKSAFLPASALALAALWDPLLRWGTMVVRPETWIGLCWLVSLREMHQWEVAEKDSAEKDLNKAKNSWPKTAWTIAGCLAMAAYFHFEAIYLVPATIVGLGFSRGWLARLIGVGARTVALLSPWLLYVAIHFGLFLEQMQVQFARLAHGNRWLNSAYSLFHGMFLDLGSPAGWPKFFNLGKGLFWLALLGVTAVTLIACEQIFLTRRSTEKNGPIPFRRALFASAAAFTSFFYLWATKDEAWFVTLCHLVFWPWVGCALIWQLGTISAEEKAGKRPSRWATTAESIFTYVTASCAIISGATAITQARAMSPDYTLQVYQDWVTCIERAVEAAPRKAPQPRVWQPHVPDVLVELGHRHSTWDLTRVLDFPARRELALSEGAQMDAVIFTRTFNLRAVAPYTGEPRASDLERMGTESELPFGPWGLERLRAGTVRASVCERGPCWAMIISTAKI